ncbi:uncharacterized protein LOC112689392 [Sipha flava]|uniref:Uncharacterized protein LOC112689392 n=1 Tax=Sipha flava TaxID=143950 RepID=A0A8B8G8D8_9HEMI|nr:uncharacterized protein LOC112689392 [Sipha flava]
MLNDDFIHVCSKNHLNKLLYTRCTFRSSSSRRKVLLELIHTYAVQVRKIHILSIDLTKHVLKNTNSKSLYYTARTVLLLHTTVTSNGKSSWYTLYGRPIRVFIPYSCVRGFNGKVEQVIERTTIGAGILCSKAT